MGDDAYILDLPVDTYFPENQGFESVILHCNVHACKCESPVLTLCCVGESKEIRRSSNGFVWWKKNVL